MPKKAKYFLLIVLVICIGAYSLIFAHADSGTIAVNSYSLSYSTTETKIPVDPNESLQSTEGGKTNTSLSGSTITISATSSKHKTTNIIITKVHSYAQNYRNTITLTNSTASVLRITYAVEGVDGLSNGEYLDTVQPGGVLSFSVTTKVTNKSLNNTTTATGKITIKSIEALAGIDVVFAASSHGSYSYSVGEDPCNVAMGANKSQTYSVTVGATVTLTAQESSEGYQFYGWMANGKLLGKTSGAYSIQEDSVIYPAFLPVDMVSEGEVYTVGSNSYMFWNDAFVDAVSSNKPVVLAREFVLENELEINGLCADYSSAAYLSFENEGATFSIPYGSTFLVPYNTENTVIKDDMADYVLLESIGVEHRRLTMNEGTSITANGSFCVGSRSSKQMVGQVGDYGAVVMNEGSNITVNSGGKLYAYGYIFRGNEGSGTVIVHSGGIVYECAFIMDYTGSAGSAQDLYNAGVFPMRAYTMRNVEVPMTFEYGAVGKAFYSMYSDTLSSKFDDYLTYVGVSGNDSVFTLTGENATLTKSYVGGRQIFDLYGDMELCSASISVAISIIDIKFSTAQTSGLILPSGYIINYGGGTLTLKDNVIMSEGTKITIEQGGTIDANKKNLYILDADQDPGAKSATDVHGNAYTQVKTDAVIDCNGTANIDGGFYASTGKASIISSKGTGVVQIKVASNAEKSLSFKSSTSTATTITVYPAWFQNGNTTYESHISTGEYGVATYRYDKNTERWYSLAVNPDGEDNDAQTEIDVEYRVQDYLWFNGVCYLGTVDAEAVFDEIADGAITVNYFDTETTTWKPTTDIEFVVVGNAVYLVRKVPSDEIPDEIIFLLKYQTDETTYLSVPITVSLAAYKAEAKNDALIDAMLAYGQASKYYFDDTLTWDGAASEKTPTGTTTDVGNEADPSSSVTGVSLKTAGATIYFDEALRLGVSYELKGDWSGYTIEQIGLLVGDTTWSGTLTTSNRQMAYLVYNVANSTLPGGEGNKPDQPGNYPVDGEFVNPTTIPTAGKVIFDLKSLQYTQDFSLRPFAVLSKTVDGEKVYYCVYGRQVSYSLEVYINRTYGKGGNEFDNLLTKTWEYAKAANAAFAG